MLFIICTQAHTHLTQLQIRKSIWENLGITFNNFLIKSDVLGTPFNHLAKAVTHKLFSFRDKN